MAHFAELDENNVVKRVLVVDNSLENRGADFLANDLKLGGRWIQTSYNHKFRKQFAGIGYIYDEINDVFIAPKPYESWLLNQNFDWQAPVAMPETGNWIWDEESLGWINGETL